MEKEKQKMEIRKQKKKLGKDCYLIVVTAIGKGGVPTSARAKGEKGEAELRARNKLKEKLKK